MTAQLGLFVVVTVGAVALVVLPLLRRPAGSAVRADYDLRVFRDQLGEIDRDVDRGLLSPAEADTARLEIQRRLLAADVEARAAHAAAVGGTRRLRLTAAVVLAVLLPLGAAAVYGLLGTPGLADQPFADRQADRLGVDTARLDRLRDEAEVLATRLETAPDDRAGWLGLAARRKQLEQYDLALAAYDRALALGGVPAETWAEIAETHVLAAGGEVSERAQAAFRNALRGDRADPRSRYYLGLAEVQSGDPLAGLAIWRDLAAGSPETAPWMPMLRQRMAQVAQQEGVLPLAVSPAHPLDLEDGTAKVVVDDSAASAAGGDQQAMIDGMVDGLAARLKETPEDYDGWMRLGRSYRVLGQPDKAAEAFAGAAAARPDDLAARVNRALALVDAGEPARPAFLTEVETIRAMAPDSPDALYLGGLAARSQGDPEEARRLWTTLRDRLPADSPARSALEEQMEALGGGAG
jgi:cytochrome c-type biogenesis protein CcmH